MIKTNKNKSQQFTAIIFFNDTVSFNINEVTKTSALKTNGDNKH